MDKPRQAVTMKPSVNSSWTIHIINAYCVWYIMLGTEAGKVDSHTFGTESYGK